MEEKRKGRGKKVGGVRIGGFGGGGGSVVVIGGAVVAAAVWGFCEFRRRRKGNGKDRGLRDFEVPGFEKVKNVEEGGDDGLKLLVLQDEKKLDLDVGVHANEVEEKGAYVEIDSSDKDVILNEEGSRLGINVEEKIQGEKDQEQCEVADGSCDESVVANLKEDEAVCAEAVNEVKQEVVEISDNSLDAYAMTSVSEDELEPPVEVESPLSEDIEVGIEEGVVARVNGVGKEEVVVQSVSPASDVDDSDDVESEESESEEDNCSEESSRGTVDSSGESNVEAVWPVESMEELSQVIKNEKNLGLVIDEIVQADDNETLKSADYDRKGIVNSIRSYEDSDEDVSIFKETPGFAAKFDIQLVNNSTQLRVWICLVFLALLVLVVAFLAQPEYLSPELARSISPF